MLKNELVAAERCWSNTPRMIKTIELLAWPFLGVCDGGSYSREKLLYVSVNSLETHGF